MTVKRISGALLGILLLASIIFEFFPHHSYEEQFRDAISAPPSVRFWLGTDALGRDRAARLVYGTRVSLLLAVAAAGLSVAFATAAGTSAGFVGGYWSTTLLSVADLFLCVPWFFLLTAIRGAMPLNTSPLVSVLMTFGLLGVLGWAGPARVLSLRTRQVVETDYIRQARATGASQWRILVRHVLPNILPIAASQFWILVPAYIITEANLSVLGLGVSEPLPSWGSLLKEIDFVQWGSPGILLPLVLLAAVAGTLQFAFNSEESH